MTITSRNFSAALPLLACSACASAPAGEGAASPSGARTSARATRPRTRAEIAATSYRDAYALIEAARPRWLQTRGVGQQVVLEIGNVEVGGVEMLRQVALDTVESIEFKDSFDVTRSGASSSQYAGTIRVTLRTRR
ncbi:MAG: hypothetical protein ICV87_12255 [Gemmatimonadetes bacterium]|nr:hypothetical protein [Gemmatimonadota bacterium]